MSQKPRTLFITVSAAVGDLVRSFQLQGDVEEWRKLYQEIGLALDCSDKQLDDSFTQEVAVFICNQPVASLKLQLAS